MAARPDTPQRRLHDRGPRPAEPWPAEEKAGTPAGGTWRDDVMGPAGLNVLAGIWLIISPWVVGYDSGDAWWNPIIFGAIITVFALIRLMQPARTAVLSLVNAGIGVWLFISGFWLADSAAASWNVWILGVIVFILAVSGLSASAGERGASADVVR
jgi:hypothetical protein